MRTLFNIICLFIIFTIKPILACHDISQVIHNPDIVGQIGAYLQPIEVVRMPLVYKGARYMWSSQYSTLHIHDLFKNTEHVSDDTLQKIKIVFPRLVCLHLNRFYKITNIDHVFLKSYVQLKTLDLNGCSQITNECMRFISTLTRLESLNLAYCNKITDDGIGKLQTLTKLTYLDLRWIHITNNSIENISSLITLKSLCLTGCNQITDISLKLLGSTLRQLASLELACCDLITDAGIKDLIPLSHLQILNVSYCNQLTDVSIRYLYNFSCLMHIDLIHCYLINDQILWEYKKRNPRCSIYIWHDM